LTTVESMRFHIASYQLLHYLAITGDANWFLGKHSKEELYRMQEVKGFVAKELHLASCAAFGSSLPSLSLPSWEGDIRSLRIVASSRISALISGHRKELNIPTRPSPILANTGDLVSRCKCGLRLHASPVSLSSLLNISGENPQCSRDFGVQGGYNRTSELI
jgi:hypothetical protein